MRILRFFFRLFLVLAVVSAVAYTQQKAIDDIIDSTRLPCEEMLYRSLMEQQNTIVLAYYGLEESELFDLWCDVAYSRADLFFVADHYTFKMLGDKVLSVTPEYTMTAPQLTEARQVFNAEMDKLRAMRDPSWTQLETALFFHDYLCMRYSYDESLSLYSAYDMLTEGTGVCQAYALIYADLMNSFGIDCRCVVSKEMNHEWNVITIDGVSYNVDVTYDDPTSDRRGRASHAYFLLSDEALSKDHSFTAEEGYGQCTDTRYDSGAVWEGVRSGFVPVGDAFYFIKSGMLYRWDGGEPEYIDTIYATWFTGMENESYWRGNHSTLWMHEDMVLYSKPKVILSYTPATGQFHVQYEYKGAEDIYGFSYINGELVLQVGLSPNEPGRLMVAEDGFRFE